MGAPKKSVKSISSPEETNVHVPAPWLKKSFNEWHQELLFVAKQWTSRKFCQCFVILAVLVFHQCLDKAKIQKDLVKPLLPKMLVLKVKMPLLASSGWNDHLLSSRLGFQSFYWKYWIIQSLPQQHSAPGTDPSSPSPGDRTQHPEVLGNPKNILFPEVTSILEKIKTQILPIFISLNFSFQRNENPVWWAEVWQKLHTLGV